VEADSMRFSVVGLGLAFAILLTATTASAHAAGSPPISVSGSFALAPENHPNATYHAYLASLGIPPGAGDTLRFSWSANGGTGSPIYFDIHTHPGNTNTSSTVLYSKMAVRDDDSWAVPGSDLYMLLWSNPNPSWANVSYSFVLLAPPPDLTVLAVFPIILAAFVFLLWVSRRRSGRTKP